MNGGVVIRCAEPAKNGEVVPFMSGRAETVYITKLPHNRGAGV